MNLITRIKGSNLFELESLRLRLDKKRIIKLLEGLIYNNKYLFNEYLNKYNKEELFDILVDLISFIEKKKKI